MPEKTVYRDWRNEFEKSVIVAAHPDDEILWFSSIIDKVKEVLICYSIQDSHPNWTNGRIQALADYPLPHVSCLNLKLSEVFNCGDWHDPRTTSYGLEIDPRQCHRQSYEDNYRRLELRLRKLFRPYNHVFTQDLMHQSKGN